MIHNLRPYPAYKYSGVPWLGEVPEHWEQLPGRACFNEKKVPNTGLQEKTVLSLSYGQIIVKPPEKLHGLVPASFETYQIVEPKDIIIRSTDLQNDQNSLRFGFVKTRGIITSAYMCFQTTELIIPEYGHLLLHTYDLMKIFYGLGSGLRQNLDWRDFKYLPCPVPPLPEQSAVVRYLDHIDRRIRHYIHAKQKLIKLLKEQKQAIIHQAVTRGLDPNVKLKPSGVEWLGDVPEHWEVRRAKQLCVGIIDCKNRTPDLIPEGEYTVVRTTCIRNGEFNLSGSYKTDKYNYDIWTQRGAPQLGDVFFTREAPAGEACLVPDREDLCMGQRMMYFRPDPELLDPLFLLFSIYGPIVRTYIEHACSGSTVGHLRLGQVYGLPLLWCPLEEQQKIVAHIEGFSTNIDKIISQANQEISLLREYRTRLIADVVTGKLDVREAAVNLPEENGKIEEDEELQCKNEITELEYSDFDQDDTDANN